RRGSPMRFRKIDDERSMRRPAVDVEALTELDEELDLDFEYHDRLLKGLDWSERSGDGILESSAVEGANLAGIVLSPLEAVDVTVDHSVLSNGRWERMTARRVEITDSQLVGWQAQFSLASDVYVADCRADFAGISI